MTDPLEQIRQKLCFAVACLTEIVNHGDDYSRDYREGVALGLDQLNGLLALLRQSEEARIEHE